MTYRARAYLCLLSACLAFWAGVAVLVWCYPPLAALQFLAFCALQLADYDITSRILARGGRELNPVVRWALARFGKAGLVAWKLVACAAGYILLHHEQTAALAVLCVLYAGIVGWNWRQAQQQRIRKS